MKRGFIICDPPQKKQLDAWCFGSCGKIKVGAVDLGFAGLVGSVCHIEEGPHVERDDPEPWMEFEGREYFLRKLKEVEE